MGKDGFLTPKAIAKRIKAKGLQKLRWYCQMCQKQCRDENGFKCHCESESHQRQISLFAQRPGRFLDAFSREFEKTFMDILKRRFGEQRVHANLVYNEYISDRHHTHMNATGWVTLNGFVRYLGKTGKAIVEETPKGWYIQYINRDPEMLAQKEAMEKKEKHDLDDEERTFKLLEKRIEEAQQRQTQTTADSTENEQGEDNQVPVENAEPIKFFLAPRKPTPMLHSTTTTTTATITTDNQLLDIKTEPLPSPLPSANDATDADVAIIEQQAKAENGTPKNIQPQQQKEIKKEIPVKFEFGVKETATPSSSSKSKVDRKRKLTADEELMLEQELAKERRNRRDYWVTPGIVVKVMNKALANGKYYKLKGVVEEVISTYVAQIKMIESGDILRLDQSQLETVIPIIGGKMKIVNGAYRGDTVVLLSLDVDKFSAKVKLVSGPHSGQVLPSVAYEDVCKIVQ